MTQGSAGHATVAQPLSHDAAPLWSGEAGSAGSDSIVSDSIVADTAASADVSGEQGEQQCFLSLQQTATSFLQSCTAEPQQQLRTHPEDVPAVLEQAHQGEQLSQAASDANKKVVVSPVAGSMSQSSRGQSHHRNSAPTSGNAPPPNNLDPPIVPEVVVSTVTPPLPVGQHSAIHQVTAACHPAACESKHPHPVTNKRLQSASFSSPACLESQLLPPHLQQHYLTHQKLAQSCTAVSVSCRSDDVTPDSCVQQPTAAPATLPTPAAPQPPVATSPAIAPQGALEPPEVFPTAAADVSDDCIQLEGRDEALQSAVFPPEHVPSKREDVRDDVHNATQFAHPGVEHNPEGDPHYTLPVTNIELENQDCSSPAMQPMHMLQTPPAWDHAIVNSCPTIAEAPYGTPKAGACSAPRLHEKEQQCCTQARPGGVVPLDQHAVEEETPACAQPHKMHPAVDKAQNSICASPSGTNEEQPTSICSLSCTAARAPVLCSPVQLSSPRSPTGVSHQEPVHNMPSSPSTPVSPPVQRKLQFSWDSPPAAPAYLQQLPRLDPDEAENLPVLLPFPEPNEEPPVPVHLRSSSDSGEAGISDWIKIHSALDGFPANVTDAADAQILPPVLGSKGSVQPLQSLTVDGASAPSSGCRPAHDKEEQGHTGIVHHQLRGHSMPVHEDSSAQPLLTAIPSLVDILQQTKALLRTGRTAKSTASDRHVGLWRRSDLAPCSKTISGTPNIPQPVELVQECCDAQVTASLSSVPTFQPVTGPPSPSPVATAPPKAEGKAPLPAKISTPHTSIDGCGRLESTIPVSNASMALKQPHADPASLRCDTKQPNAATVADETRSQSQAKASAPLKLRPLPQAGCAMFTKKRPPPQTETECDHVVPQSLPNQKKTLNSHGLVASMKRGLSSMAAPVHGSHASRTATITHADERTALSLTEQQGAANTSCIRALDCYVAAGSSRTPSNVSRKAPVPVPTTCAVSVATAPAGCSTLEPWRKVLGKQKLGGMKLQKKPLHNRSNISSAATQSGSRKGTSMTAPAKKAVPCDKDSAVACGGQEDIVLNKELQSKLGNGMAPLGTAAVLQEVTPERHIDPSHACVPVPHADQGPISHHQRQEPKPSRLQEVLCRSSSSSSSQGDKATANKLAAAVHKLDTRSQLEPCLEVGKPTFGQTFKRLLSDYSTARHAALTTVATSSLSIMDALHLQHSLDENLNSRTRSNFRMIRETQHVKHVSVALPCKRKLPEVLAECGNPLPDSKFHFSKHRTDQHKVVELQACDSHRHDQFMTAMRRRQHEKGITQSSLPATNHSTDHFSHHFHFGEQSISIGPCRQTLHPASRGHHTITHAMHATQRCMHNNVQAGEPRQTRLQPSPQVEHRDSEQEDIRLLPPAASGDVLCIEPLESDEQPSFLSPGDSESYPDPYSSDAKRSRSQEHSISLAPSTRVTSPAGFGSGAEGHSKRTEPGQAVASLKDVLEASKHRTTVRLKAANVVPREQMQDQMLPGGLVQCSPDADPQSAGQHCAANSTAMAASRLLQLCGSCTSTAFADSASGVGGMGREMGSSFNAAERSPGGMTVDKLRTLLHLIQQDSGTSEEYVSNPCTPSSPCAEVRGVSNDCPPAREDRSIVQPDRSPQNVQLQHHQASSPADFIQDAHHARERSMHERSQITSLVEHSAAGAQKMSHSCSITFKHDTQLQKEGKVSTTTEYHCRSMEKTESVVMSCSDIFKGLFD